MDAYDQIGKRYREVRSPDIGVADIRSCLKDVNPNPDVLDLGCGNGFPIALRIFPHAKRYTGVDSSAAMIAEFAENVPGAEAVHASMQDYLAEPDAFDFIFAFGSLFHLQPDDQIKTIAMVARALRPGGMFVFTSGENAGEAVGHVAGVEIPHWSLGERGYADALQPCGLQYLGMHRGEGDSIHFKAVKPRMHAS